MTQGELGFQPGWRHDAVPMASPKLSWSRCAEPPAWLHHSALRLVLPGPS